MSGLDHETIASVRHMVFASTEVLGAAASIIESIEVDHPAVGHLATAIAAAELAKRQLAPLAPVIPLPDRRRPGFRPHEPHPDAVLLGSIDGCVDYYWTARPGSNVPICAALEAIACESMLSPGFVWPWSPQVAS